MRSAARTLCVVQTAIVMVQPVQPARFVTLSNAVEPVSPHRTLFRA